MTASYSDEQTAELADCKDETFSDDEAESHGARVSPVFKVQTFLSRDRSIKLTIFSVNLVNVNCLF